MAGPRNRPLSEHPTDQLIRELIQSRRTADAAEIDAILQRLAAAPFNQEMRAVPHRDRGHTYQRRTLSARSSSLHYHLTKRVVIERQWARGTTAAQYVDDLHAAALAPSARLAVYLYGPDAVAATLSLTEDSVPGARRGARSERHVLVVYSANRGTITTGYQVSSVATTSIPAGVLWLR